MIEDPSGADRWRRMLESMLGPQAAEEAMRALESSGMDLSQLSGMPGAPADPAQFAAAMAQMRQMLTSDDDGNSDWKIAHRSEEHTSELQSRGHLVCRLLLEKKKHMHS